MPSLYGIYEIAQALGVSRAAMAQRRVRGKLPPPTAVLSMGAVWRAEDIEPWIEQHKRQGT